MLIGGIVLLLGVVLAGWLSPSPVLTTLDPGESIVMELSAEAGDLLLVVINVHNLQDLAPWDGITTSIQFPSGRHSGGGGLSSRSITFATDTGIYTIVLQNGGLRAIAFDYSVTTTSSTEMTLAAASVPLGITGFFILVGGLGLRFAGRSLRRLREG